MVDFFTSWSQLQRIKTNTLLLLFFSLLLSCFGYAQEEKSSLDASVASNTFASLSKKTTETEEQIDKATEKYLSKLQKQEAKLKKKLFKKDSLLAKQLFTGVECMSSKESGLFVREGFCDLS